jgi:hypothetical protein
MKFIYVTEDWIKKENKLGKWKGFQH